MIKKSRIATTVTTRLGYLDMIYLVFTTYTTIKTSKLSDDLKLFSLIILLSISYDKYLNTAELVVAN